MTEYVVLKFHEVLGEHGAWVIIGKAETRGPRTAIREIINGAEGSYVAVPARSWHPSDVKLETKTLLRFQ